ncbi:type II toxin-antitoxin system HipA family toxin [Trebonia kvetii]|uniref:Type II toxin-antitoxin system HipA family toxin n=1 Tax=Trebonia kvetii TaxID=2480626 RepID=A0A6P2BV76_9ACTN|nr:HipA domain-containing protein [Trebonia kvetii]TVZ03039.1 type II toxin-antitoxin system HipA family toxin [Trebonia kvetii]
MTTSDPRSAFAWTWLPGAAEPVVVGRIDVEGPLHTFTYARSYRQRTDAMALYEPELPVSAGVLRPHGGLTIAGCLRDAAPDSWGQRVILARHIGHLTGDSDTSELSMLTYLLESGSDRIGALDFLESPAEYVPRDAPSATLEQLMAAAADIETGRMLPPALAEALTRGSSIGGARPKVLLTAAGRSLIAKFSSTSDIRPVVKAEAVAMELARRCGLKVAGSEVARVAGKDVLLVDRFDRPGGGRRHHMVSALTILGLDDFTGARYGSYATLADHVRRSFTDPADTLRELFGRIVFNVLVGNTDDHPRNHAAFVNADGSLTLTPAYDICPQPRSVPQANQAMAIGRAGERSSQLSTCLGASEVYLLAAAEAKAIIDTQVEIIRTQWRDAADTAQLTELDRRQLFGREILNEFVFRD